MSGGYTPQEAYDAVPQLHLQAKVGAANSELAMTQRPSAACFSVLVLMYTIGLAATAGTSAAHTECRT
jgi:hypothetical protein